jgi:hypothetical protein
MMQTMLAKAMLGILMLLATVAIGAGVTDLHARKDQPNHSAAQASPSSPSITVHGYVLDSACAFTKALDKPISDKCATMCAKAGSPLVILSFDGAIYWPIADTTPATSQNTKLLPFAGEKVNATGKVYQRGGSTAIVIEKIERQAPAAK